MILGGIDIETTGLAWADGHRIVELCITTVGDGNVALGGMKVRFNPQRPIDAKAFEVHGISLQELQHEPVWSASTVADVRAAIESCDVLVAHNGRGFDLPFINAELMRVGLAKLTRPLIDTCEDGRWATPIGKVPNLGELCFACGIDYDPEQAHGAEYDVKVMLDAYFAASRKGFFKLPQALAKAA